jgi:hypothetical protein
MKLFRIVHQIDAWTSTPRIPNFKPSCYICSTCCWMLIPHTGVDESGKKGIFPSNYVRLSIPDKEPADPLRDSRVQVVLA